MAVSELDRNKVIRKPSFQRHKRKLSHKNFNTIKHKSRWDMVSNILTETKPVEGEREGVMENHFSPRGTWVCSYSHCHPQTAIIFLFTGFLETYSNLPLHFAPSLQACIRWGPWFTFIKKYKKDAHTTKLPCNLVFTDHPAFTYLPPHHVELLMSKMVQSLHFSSYIRHHFGCG